MAVYAATIAGNAVTLLDLRINESANRNYTATFDIVSLNGMGLPVMDDEVLITEDVGSGPVLIFGGLIDSPSYEGFGGKSKTAIVTKCSAVDFNTLIDRRVLNISVAEGSLESFVNELAAYLTQYGVTVDGAQPTGPTVLAQQFYFMTLRRAWQLLSDQTHYLPRIDYGKSLSMTLPSATPCPFDISTANQKAEGDIKVVPTREDFANRILVLGGSGTLPVTDAFTGDGSTDAFELNYTLAISAGYVSNGGLDETLGPVGDPGGPTWEWSTTNGTTTITRVDGAPVNLAAISINYTAYFPKLVTAGDDPQVWTPENLVERILPYPDVFDVTVLQALADKWLERANVERRRVTYQTREVGVHPGQTTKITVPERGLSGTFTITDVAISVSAGNRLIRTVTAIEGDTYLAASWQDDVETWGKAVNTGSGAAPMTAGTISVPVGAAPPLKAVQFNRNGSFGGDGEFTYDEDTNVLIAGEDCAVTATNPRNGYIFGKNCHAVDP